MSKPVNFKNKRRYKNKRMLLTAAAAVLLVVIIVLAVAMCGKPESKPTQTDADSVTSVEGKYDTDITLSGDVAIDPENADIADENGADVKVEDLSVEAGRSNGIDVSKWQGKIDWKKVKNSGIEFAFIRIGYRGEDGVIYKDDNADYNIQQAQKAGVLVGVYFFSTAINETEAAEEAGWTLQAIQGYSISYPVVYDCEGFKLSASRMHSLAAPQRTNNALAFLKKVSDAGYDAMFYGARNEINNSAYWEISRIDAKYKIWVAQYPAVTYPQKDKPDYSNRCDAWQYTNKGTVSGVSGNVDMVVCYFTKEKAQPKNKAATPGTASTPLSDEEKIYTKVNETVTAKEVTNLRTAATTKSDIVASLKNGEEVTRIGVGSNGWSKLNYNGKTVYAITSYLTTDLSDKVPSTLSTPSNPQNDVVSGNTFTPKNDNVTAKEVVNLRALPTTDSEIVGTLKSGDFLERTAVSNKGWSRLNFGGKTVYAITSYLSNEVIKTPSAPQSDGFTAVDEQVTAKSETNLRTAPSTENSEVVYTLKNGEYVKRIGLHTNGWSKLEYKGQTVYAITSYLTQ